MKFDECNRPIGLVVKYLVCGAKVLGSIIGLAKSDPASSAARHLCDVSVWAAAEMDLVTCYTLRRDTANIIKI